MFFLITWRHNICLFQWIWRWLVILCWEFFRFCYQLPLRKQKHIYSIRNRGRCWSKCKKKKPTRLIVMVVFVWSGYKISIHGVWSSFNTHIHYCILSCAVFSSLWPDALCCSMWLCGSGNMLCVRHSHIACTVSLLILVHACHLHWWLALHQGEGHMGRSHFSLVTGFYTLKKKTIIILWQPT